MPIRIKRLKCNVTVRTGRKGPALHRDEKYQKLSMAFAVPEPQPLAEQEVPEPSNTVTEEHASPPSPKPGVSAGQADVRAVADRVYEMMRQEVIMGRQRGGWGRRG